MLSDEYIVSFGISLNNCNLLFSQPIQLIHQLIDRPIRRLNLPGQHRLLLFEPRILQFLIQVQHLRDEGDHAIVPGDIGRVVGVDGAGIQPPFSHCITRL